MNERDFVFWLKGYIEIHKPMVLDKEELDVIKEHLDKVVPYKSNITDHAARSGLLPTMPPLDAIIC